jgi:hypothetical protein
MQHSYFRVVVGGMAVVGRVIVTTHSRVAIVSPPLSWLDPQAVKYPSERNASIANAARTCFITARSRS